MGFEINFNSRLNSANQVGGMNKSKAAGHVDKIYIDFSAKSVDNNSKNFGLNDLAGVSAKAKMNSPEAQGLASAQDVQNGKLVSGFHFDSLGECDTRLFAIKYNSANTPSIANGTNVACENIEYAGVAGNLAAAAKDSPFAELFA